MAATDPVAPEPRRFSIRLPRPLWIGLAAVVLVVVAVALRFGLPMYRQQNAIREIEREGGWVTTTAGGPDFMRRWIGDAKMTMFDHPATIVIRGSNCKPIEELKSATSLCCWCTEVRDDQLVSLVALQRLEILDLRHTLVTGVGLRHLEKLPALRRLGLDRTRITDESLASVATMTNLEILGLSGTPVSDSGLECLHALKNLRCIDLTGTMVTDVGVARLQQELPRLKIEK